jgi:hypothetical protein
VAKTTGPILLMGAVVIGNQVVLNNRDLDVRIPLATGLAAGAFALLERVSQQLAVGIAWTALVAVLLGRVDPNVPSPVESLNTWWEKTSL